MKYFLLVLPFLLFTSCDLAIEKAGSSSTDVKVYDKLPLSAVVEYSVINNKSVYECSNYNLFQTFIGQYSGTDNNEGNRIFNRNLFFSTSGMTNNPDGTFTWSGITSVLDVDYDKTLNTVGLANANRTDYNTIVGFPNNNVVSVGTTYGERQSSDITNNGLLFSFQNFIVPSSSVSDPFDVNNVTYTFEYQNDYIASITYNKDFNFQSWKENRFETKYFYKIYKIIITKPYQYKYDTSALNLILDASLISNYSFFGNKLTLDFADVDTPLTGELFNFAVIDFDNDNAEYTFTFRFN